MTEADPSPSHQRFLKQTLDNMTLVGRQLLDSMMERPYFDLAPDSATMDMAVAAPTLVHTYRESTNEHRARLLSDRVVLRPAPMPTEADMMVEAASATTAAAADMTVEEVPRVMPSTEISTLPLSPPPPPPPTAAVAATTTNPEFIISSSQSNLLEEASSTVPETMAATTTTSPAAAVATSVPAYHLLIDDGWRIVSHPSDSAESAERRQVAAALKGKHPDVYKQRTAMLQPEDYYHVVDPRKQRYFVTDVGVPTTLVQKNIFFEPSEGMLTHKKDGPEWVRTLRAAIPKGPNGKQKYLAQHPDEFWPSCLFKVKPRRTTSAAAAGGSSGHKRGREDGDEDDDDDDDGGDDNGEEDDDAVATPAKMMNGRAASLMGSNDMLAMVDTPLSSGGAAASGPRGTNGGLGATDDDPFIFTVDQSDLLLGLSQPGVKAQDAWRKYTEQFTPLLGRVETAHITPPTMPMSTTLATTAKPFSPASTTTTAIVLGSPKKKASAKAKPKAAATEATSVVAKPVAKPKPVAKAAAAALAPAPGPADWFEAAYTMVNTAHGRNMLPAIDKRVQSSREHVPLLWQTDVGATPNYKAHPYFIKFVLPLTAEVYQRYVLPKDNPDGAKTTLPLPSNKPFNDWFDVALFMVLQARNSGSFEAKIKPRMQEARAANPELFERFGERSYEQMKATAFYGENFANFVLPIMAEVYKRCIVPLSPSS